MMDKIVAGMTAAAPKLFREWFLEEYDIGIASDTRYQECISFLIGLHQGTEGEVKQYLSMCISTLRMSRAFIDIATEHKVVKP